MANAAKRKGDRWERALVDWFNDNGFPHVERRYGAGQPHDRGDIIGIPGACIEAKNHKRIALAEFVDEAVEEAEEAGAAWPIAIVKRRYKPTEEAYAVMPLWALADLLLDGNGDGR